MKTQDRKAAVEVQFSIKGGFYDEAVELELYSIPGARIFYTTTGDEPSRGAAVRYKKPIKISRTTVVRAFARKKNRMSWK